MCKYLSWSGWRCEFVCVCTCTYLSWRGWGWGGSDGGERGCLWRGQQIRVIRRRVRITHRLAATKHNRNNHIYALYNTGSLQQNTTATITSTLYITQAHCNKTAATITSTLNTTQARCNKTQPQQSHLLLIKHWFHCKWYM